VSKLAPAPAPGDPFVDETASTIAKCQRGLWDSVQEFVVRAVTGKKPAATATAAQCALPAKTPAKPAAKPAAKPVAKPVAKPAVCSLLNMQRFLDLLYVGQTGGEDARRKARS
jgi:hypothetical protein